MTILNLEVPPKIHPIYQNTKRYVCLEGGRGSGKSWGVADYLIVSGYKNIERILCTREVQNSIRDSVHKLLKDRIQVLGLSAHYIVTDKTIRGMNGTEFIFKGLRNNTQNIKSTEGITKAWVEESQSVSRASLGDLDPTIRQEGSQILFTYNRQTYDDPVHSDYVESGMPDVLHINMNYYDNPKFPDVLKRQMLWDKKTNYDKYLHVWEGQPVKHSDAQIFNGKWTIDNFEAPDNMEFYYGADWGFSNDPTCLVRCYVLDDNLYIDHEAYGVGVELDEIGQLFNAVPDSKKNKITADNSRPDTISFLNRHGWVIRPSRKGKNSIEDGIEFIKSFKKVIIHERCKNTVYEFKSYSYKEDKHTGEILPIIIDKDNHIIDSLRYALEDMRKGLNQKLSLSNYKTQDILFK